MNYRAIGNEPDPSWMSSPCPGATVRFRQWPDGRIEIEGRGFETCGRDCRPDVDQWHKVIWAASKKHGVPANWIAATVAIESSGKPNQQASGHYGLMMLGLPAAAEAAKEIGLPPPTSGQLLSDNALNIELGTVYLKQRLQSTKVNGLMPLAAVAYNAGGIYCGAGCAIKKADCKVDCCELRCPSNEWGLVGECNQVKGEWVAGTYATKAVRFGNHFWANGFGPGMDNIDWPPKPGPQPTPSGGEDHPLVEVAREHWGAALLGAAAGVALVYVGQVYLLPALQRGYARRARA